MRLAMILIDLIADSTQAVEIDSSSRVQMATLSRRHYHVVCALVSPLSHLGGTDGGDDQGKRSGDQPLIGDN
jgi:hypothetical protein